MGLGCPRCVQGLGHVAAFIRAGFVDHFTKATAAAITPTVMLSFGV